MLTFDLIYASGTAWYLDSKFWVLIPVLLFFALLFWKGAFKSMGQGLDNRAEAIRNELDEARRLREEAQALLASYQRKKADAEEQAQEIIERARREADAMATQAEADLALRIQRREAQAEAKIASAKAQAVADVKSRAADLAIDAVKDIARSKLTATDKTRFFKDGLSEISGSLKS